MPYCTAIRTSYNLCLIQIQELSDLVCTLCSASIFDHTIEHLWYIIFPSLMPSPHLPGSAIPTVHVQLKYCYGYAILKCSFSPAEVIQQ